MTAHSPAHELDAGQAGEQLPAWARLVADGVDLAQIAQVVVERDLEAAFPHLRGHAEFVERLRASVAENLRALQDVLCGRRALQEVRLVEPFAFAAVQAQLRVPQTSLQRSYRVGFLAMWEEWSRRLVAHAEAEDLPRTEALSALHTLTSLLLAYHDHSASQVAESYARTDEALSRSRAHVRSGLVRQLLRADASPLSPSDLVILDYPLDGTHAAILLPTVAEGAAVQMLTGLRNASRTRNALVHAVDLSSSVIWLTRPGAWSDVARQALLDHLTVLGVQASVSELRSGPDGLRETWHQVLEIERVRAAWGALHSPRLLRHSDVSLEVLLMRDPALARRFAEEELGPLAEPNEQAARLRETLEASFRWGSHVTTAEHLYLHEHTVRNRLVKAGELLGRPLQERRTELQVALRLIRLLDQE
jgi:hypothetical protein